MNRSQDNAADREATRGRVRYLLEHRWGGSQRQMSRDLGVSQGLISKVVSGQQGPGNRFLAAIARQPGVNEDWLYRGAGRPMNPPTRGTLPTADWVMPGLPLAYPHLLTGERYPVAEPFDRPTRYWLRVGEGHSWQAMCKALLLRAGDLLLMEGDPASTSRLGQVEGRLCGVRLEGATPEPEYLLGMVYVPDGIALDLFWSKLYFVRRPDGAFALEASRDRASTLESPPSPWDGDRAGQALRNSTDPEYDSGERQRPQRNIRDLDDEQERGKRIRASEAERSSRLQELQAAEAEERRLGLGAASAEAGGSVRLYGVVSVCVYQARPSPVWPAR
jgi:hypothetical protein